MVAEVLYRKWRPQTLAAVVGQEHVTRTLLNALAQGRVAHAYLFCGPRGTGKTSTARILAKAVNCARNGKGEPCDECEQCLGVSRGSALDLIEIDAASNRGIDEVRELRERVNYSPAEAPFKVYIIDEVHMMTTPAFNALLKVLEEPPGHVIFILATTEAHRLPMTIVSRCQRFDFRRLSQGSVEGRLRELCEDEGVSVGDWAMKSIVRASEGSLRDAENLLEQLIVSYGTNIEADHLKELLGVSSGLPIVEIAEGMLNGDLPGALRTLHGVAEQGLNLKHFHQEMQEHLRRLLLIKSGAGDIIEMPEEDLEGAREQASRCDIGALQRALTSWSNANVKIDSSGAMHLEMALIEVALGAGRPASEGQGVTVREPARKPTPASTPRAVASTPVKPANQTPRAEKPKPTTTAADNKISVTTAGAEEPVKPMKVADLQPAPVSQERGDISDFKEKWPALVDALRGVGSKGSLDALLRSACEPVALEGDTLVIGFYHEFHKSRIDDPKYRHLVEKKVNDVFGGPYRIRCDLVDKNNPTPAPAYRDTAREVREAGPANGGYGQPRERQSSGVAPGGSAAEQGHGPLVKAALEMGARVMEQG